MPGEIGLAPTTVNIQFIMRQAKRQTQRTELLDLTLKLIRYCVFRFFTVLHHSCRAGRPQINHQAFALPMLPETRAKTQAAAF